LLWRGLGTLGGRRKGENVGIRKEESGEEVPVAGEGLFRRNQFHPEVPRENP